MRTSAMAPAFAATTIATDTPQSRSDQPSFFTRIYNAMIASQELRARRVVYAHLAHHDDATLKRLGWSLADIEQLRRAVRNGGTQASL